MALATRPAEVAPAPVPVVAAPAYAGLVTRTVAYVIDILIMATIALAVTVCGGLLLSALLPHRLSPNFAAVFLTATAWVIFGAIYFVGFWTLLGQTPGMRLMRIEVLAYNGRRPNVMRGLIRLVGLTLATIPLGLGFAIILFDERRRGLQDLLAGTVVVHAPERRLGSGWSG
jgi:uncharacterized RDD family membrane protein YckC